MSAGGTRKAAQFFERMLNSTNLLYQAQKRAVIHKIATPAQGVKGRMTFTTKSTVDYVGALAPRGRTVAFDAKTSHGTTFPIGHIRPHQVDYLKAVRGVGGVAFFLIWMVECNRIWVLPITDEFLSVHWDTARRPSLTIGDLSRLGVEVTGWSETYPQCDYLAAAQTWKPPSSEFNVSQAVTEHQAVTCGD